MEVDLVLERFAYLPNGTLGKMSELNTGMSVYTLERPWLDNKPWRSCIPTGGYALGLHFGKRWPHAILVRNVPDRSHILLHPANSPSQLHGCIAPGLDWSVNHQTPLVQSSTAALDLIHELCGLPSINAGADEWDFEPRTATVGILTIRDAESALKRPERPSEPR